MSAADFRYSAEVVRRLEDEALKPQHLWEPLDDALAAHEAECQRIAERCDRAVVIIGATLAAAFAFEHVLRMCGWWLL